MVPQQPALSLGFGEFFDGVAEHRAGHLVRMPLKKTAQRRHIFLPHFPEHPARRFVHQIVFMLE